MNGHPLIHQREERQRALANLAHHLNQALAHLHAAQHYNLMHALGLDLPREAVFIAAITEAARIAKQPEAPPL